MSLHAKAVTTTKALRAEVEAGGWSPATEEDIVAMSATFNEFLEYLVPGSDRNASWITLFKAADDDGSGVIRWDEFEDMARNELKFPKADFPDLKLKQLWWSPHSPTHARSLFRSPNSTPNQQPEKKLV